MTFFLGINPSSDFGVFLCPYARNEVQVLIFRYAYVEVAGYGEDGVVINDSYSAVLFEGESDVMVSLRIRRFQTGSSVCQSLKALPLSPFAFAYYHFQFVVTSLEVQNGSVLLGSDLIGPIKAFAFACDVITNGIACADTCADENLVIALFHLDIEVEATGGVDSSCVKSFLEVSGHAPLFDSGEPSSAAAGVDELDAVTLREREISYVLLVAFELLTGNGFLYILAVYEDGVRAVFTFYITCLSKFDTRQFNRSTLSRERINVTFYEREFLGRQEITFISRRLHFKRTSQFGKVCLIVQDNILAVVLILISGLANVEERYVYIVVSRKDQRGATTLLGSVQIIIRRISRIADLHGVRKGFLAIGIRSAVYRCCIYTGNLQEAVVYMYSSCLG